MAQRSTSTEARHFVEGRQVDEDTFWREVERIAREGYRAQIIPAEVCWRLTPEGEAMARLIRRQGALR